MMPTTKNRKVMIWLYAFAFVVAALIVFGGFVRLTRSGLSIVEWEPVSGVLPPIGEKAWEVEFGKYQLTPEFQKVNFNMTLAQYKRIFTIEWAHRLIARLAGLFYAIPVFYFLFKRIIPPNEFGVYFVMGVLFISQAVMGWVMVASGLVDRPSVSHIRLTIHLLFALTLMGMSLWAAFGHRFGFQNGTSKAKWTILSKLAIAGLGVLVVQVSYGGLTAGLKAGYISNTWPLLFGKWIPANLFNGINKLIDNPMTILIVHRWWAFAALAFGVGLCYAAFRKGYPRKIIKNFVWILGLGVIQITLGVLVTIYSVPISLALIHQATAVILFGLALNISFHLRALDHQKRLEES